MFFEIRKSAVPAKNGVDMIENRDFARELANPESIWGSRGSGFGWITSGHTQSKPVKPVFTVGETPSNPERPFFRRELPAQIGFDGVSPHRKVRIQESHQSSLSKRNRDLGNRAEIHRNTLPISE